MPHHVPRSPPGRESGAQWARNAVKGRRGNWRRRERQVLPPVPALRPPPARPTPPAGGLAGTWLATGAARGATPASPCVRSSEGGCGSSAREASSLRPCVVRSSASGTPAPCSTRTSGSRGRFSTTPRETKRKFFAPPLPPQFQCSVARATRSAGPSGKIEATTWGMNIEIGGPGRRRAV